jgi:hypothetical protein
MHRKEHKIKLRHPEDSLHPETVLHPFRRVPLTQEEMEAIKTAYSQISPRRYFPKISLSPLATLNNLADIGMVSLFINFLLISGVLLGSEMMIILFSDAVIVRAQAIELIRGCLYLNIVIFPIASMSLFLSIEF